ncbi:DUF1971 domain-containing protein [Morganella morganii]|uniref:DUF1971 domain-containing protein n=1 Tax=Morganella morganii TaxID=582 RepID=UPI003EB75627
MPAFEWVHVQLHQQKGMISLSPPTICNSAVYPKLSVMQGTIVYYSYADETSPEPTDTLVIQAGQFGVFPPETWHRIEAVTDDTVFNVDFYVAPEILTEE